MSDLRRPDDWVTQDEALAVARLLESLREAPADGLSLEEVAELMQVTTEEARVLLMVVRQASPRLDEAKWRRRYLGRLAYWAIGAFTVFAALQAAALYGKFLAHPEASSSDLSWLVILSVWTAGAFWYYRKPVFDVLRRFWRGHPGREDDKTRLGATTN